jgi:GNAT superfamily N-acetyltransferase
MPAYRVRAATLDDAPELSRQRIGMFTDMGVPLDAAALGGAFVSWLAQTMPSGAYRAWLVEDDRGGVIGGGGITIVPWPPGPRYPGDRLAFVYNVYTEPAHRHRGVARLVMDAIHAWCRQNQVGSLALNASTFGRSLYESLGYHVSPSPMMFLQLEP